MYLPILFSYNACPMAFRAIFIHLNNTKLAFLILIAFQYIVQNKNIYIKALLETSMEKDIGKIKKNDNADIIVRVDDFGGRIGLTIREFVTGERYTGFTKAGVRISAENFPKFKDMINSVKDEDMKEAKKEQPEEESLDEIEKEIKEQIEEDEEIPDY